MEGVFEHIRLSLGEKKSIGDATLSTYEFKSVDNPLYNLRLLRDGNSFMKMEDGRYVRLHVDGDLVMSDTRMEKSTNTEFIRNANGHVFIGGLGIGLILYNLRKKVKDGTVTKITVMEKSGDVIELISPYYNDMPIEYICADVLKYDPPKGILYDTIYFDIWATINTDNLKEIATLHQRWKFRKNKQNPQTWMGSWMQDFLKAKKREEQREYNYW